MPTRGISLIRGKPLPNFVWEGRITSFDMQTSKWNSIPERSKDIYDRLPEMMGKKIEKVTVKPEDLDYQEYEMHRVAYYLNKAADSFLKLAELDI